MCGTHHIVWLIIIYFSLSDFFVHYYITIYNIKYSPIRSEVGLLLLFIFAELVVFPIEKLFAFLIGFEWASFYCCRCRCCFCCWRCCYFYWKIHRKTDFDCVWSAQFLSRETGMACQWHSCSLSKINYIRSLSMCLCICYHKCACMYNAQYSTSVFVYYLHFNIYKYYKMHRWTKCPFIYIMKCDGASISFHPIKITKTPAIK